MARGSSEYNGQRRVTGVILIQVAMQGQYGIFIAFAVAPNKPGRAFK